MHPRGLPDGSGRGGMQARNKADPRIESHRAVIRGSALPSVGHLSLVVAGRRASEESKKLTDSITSRNALS